MSALRLYLKYVAVSIRAQMQYRASFILMSLGHFLISVIEIIGIWVLFERFKSLTTWTLAEVALLYGLVNVAFAVAEGVGRGFDTFPGMVRGGDFDRVLLRPRSTALQVAGRELHLMRVGRLAQGLIVLIWAAAALNLDWTAARAGLALFAVLGGVCLFCGLFVVQATLAFWTTETLELMNILTYGGTEAARYPITIYRPWFRRFFTFVVPLACVTYFPALAILGRPDAALGTPRWFHAAAPAVGGVSLLAALQFWRFGTRHYCSTGS